jgi:cell division protein ZapE
MLQNIIDNLKNQGIEPDLAQSNLIEELNNTSPKNNTFINKIKKNKPSFKSFYLWGDVGRGKTVILKSFIKNLDLKVIDFHYIDFMQSIHSELSSLSGKKNPLDHIAKSFKQKERSHIH